MQVPLEKSVTYSLDPPNNTNKPLKKRKVGHNQKTGLARHSKAEGSWQNIGKCDDSVVIGR